MSCCYFIMYITVILHHSSYIQKCNGLFEYLHDFHSNLFQLMKLNTVWRVSYFYGEIELSHEDPCHLIHRNTKPSIAFYDLAPCLADPYGLPSAVLIVSNNKSLYSHHFSINLMNLLIVFYLLIFCFILLVVLYTLWNSVVSFQQPRLLVPERSGYL